MLQQPLPVLLLGFSSDDQTSVSSQALIRLLT